MSLLSWDIKEGLLSEALTGSQLQTLLTSDPLYLSAFKELISSRSIKKILADSNAFNALSGSNKALDLLFSNPYAMDYMADNDNATQILTSSSNALIKFVDSQIAIAAYNKSSTRKARINTYVNKTGSKLKRVIYTSSDSLAISGTILKASYFLVGSGGNGASTTSSNTNGNGGGGGQIVNGVISSGFPSNGAAVTIANNTATAIAGLTSAASAVNATTSTTSAGAGTTSGDDITGYLPFVISNDLLNNFWSFGNYSLKGGNGGTSGADPTAASSLFGSIGKRSQYDGDGADAGIGIASGGQRGGGSTYSQAGEDAISPNFGSGGGGGLSNISVAGASGGSGCTGFIGFYYIVS